MKKQNKVKAALQSKRTKKTRKPVPEKRFELLGKDTYQDVYGRVGSSSADSRYFTDKQLRGIRKEYGTDSKSNLMRAVVDESKGKCVTADCVRILEMVDPSWRPEGRLAVFFSYRKEYRAEHSTTKKTRK